MMAKRNFFCGTLAVALAFGLVLAGCGGGKSALLGRWMLVEGSGYDDVELLKDGSGIVDGNAVSWKVENNRMYVTRSERTMTYDYQLAGSTLTLTDDDGGILIYLKPGTGGSSALVGRWIPIIPDEAQEAAQEAAQEPPIWEFTKDGKLTIGGRGGGKWAANKNKLFITDFDTFEYKVSGSTLTLTSLKHEELNIRLKKE